MNSGIYMLQFKTGDTYIGQAKDFQQRWERHDKEMLAGKHTRLVQDAYRRSGCVLPTKHKLAICHPDWLDHYEALYIYRRRPALNTQIPRPPGEWEEGLLDWMLEAERADLGMLEQLGQVEALVEENTRVWATNKDLLDQYARVGEETWRAYLQSEHGREQEGRLRALSDELGSVRGELEQLRLFRQSVESAGWLSRLLKLW